MIKSIAFSLFAVTLFALGAVGSWYLSQVQMKQADAGQETDDLIEVAHTEPAPTAKKDEPDLSEFSAPVYGPAPTAEDIFRFSELNKKNLELLEKRKEALRQDELRLKLIEKDLDIRKKEIEGVLEQSQEAVLEAERMFTQVQTEIQKLRAEKEAAEQAAQNNAAEASTQPAEADTAATDAEVEAAFKKAVKIFEGMTAESLATSFEQLMDNGETQFVVDVVRSMEPRKASKAVEAVADRTKRTELMQSLQRAMNLR